MRKFSDTQGPTQLVLTHSVTNFNGNFNGTFRTERVRKTSILRQTSPFSNGMVSPTEKKNVRFADSMGYQLESIKYFSPQLVRRHSLNTGPLLSLSNNFCNQFNLTSQAVNKEKCNLVPSNFTMPSFQGDFMCKLQEQSVLLHSLTTSENTVYGIVSVVNHSFVKKVYVRYSFNDWASHIEQEGNYMLGSHDNESNTDKFTFTIYGNRSDFIQNSPILFHPRLFFAIRFETDDGRIFWDNNNGKNYCLNYLSF